MLMEKRIYLLNGIEYSTDDFGSGRSKTEMMIEAWNNETYGVQNDSKTNLEDMWGVIQDEVVKRMVCSFKRRMVCIWWRGIRKDRSYRRQLQ